MKGSRLIAGFGVLALLLGVQFSPTAALAKEFDIDGTLDCGVSHGRRCFLTDNNTVGVITSSVSGRRERVVVDLSWVLKKIRSFNEDDHVQYTVRSGIGRYLQVISIVERHGEGTDNPGLSTGSKLVPRDTQPKKEKDDHRD